MLDQNDVEPKFERQNYRVEVLENTVRQRLLTVVASDMDEGENGRITYSIQGN